MIHRCFPLIYYQPARCQSYKSAGKECCYIAAFKRFCHNLDKSPYRPDLPYVYSCSLCTLIYHIIAKKQAVCDSKVVRIIYIAWGIYFDQVEATTAKRPMVMRGNGLFSWVTKCTGITARPVLTGMYYSIVTHICFTEFAKKTTTLLKK